MFLDETKIHVKAGDGGNGLVAFRREKYVPQGGPAGGDGGKGGDIVLIVNNRLNTLTSLRYKQSFRAEAGKRGGNFKKTGAGGDDCIIEVPPGTMVRDEETGLLLADLTMEGQRAVLARGGRGGRGNARFKSSTNQAPRVGEKGAPGEERWLLLELKLLADAGIIGVPNAGKSTLLSVISSAKPKIADYPFTTLTPNLGVAWIGEREVVFADIPGLVEGAHAGVGLGHSFLRHIQRTRVLLHLLDGVGNNPLADFAQINSELALFDEHLATRPQLVILTKMDMPQAQEKWSEVKKTLEARGFETMAISSLTHLGIQNLMNRVAELLATLPEPTIHEEEVPIFSLQDDKSHFEIVREGEDYRVIGTHIERAAAMTYWEFDEAVTRFQRILDVLGVTDALEEAGCSTGDTVHIGTAVLEWVNEARPE